MDYFAQRPPALLAAQTLLTAGAADGERVTTASGSARESMREMTTRDHARFTALGWALVVPIALLVELLPPERAAEQSIELGGEDTAQVVLDRDDEARDVQVASARRWASAPCRR
jgi:hypothetical protein